MRRLQVSVSIFVILTFLLSLLPLSLSAQTGSGSIERLQWASVSYVYFQVDTRGNLSLGEGAYFGDSRNVVFYTLTHNPTWENKKIKNIKSIEVETIHDVNKIPDYARELYTYYSEYRGGFSSYNIIQQEIRNGNSLYIQTNLAVNPPFENNNIDVERLVDITTKDAFDALRNRGATIPDTIGDLRYELEQSGAKLYIMPMFLMFTVEVEIEGELPDLYVKPITANTGSTEEGKKYTGTVTFGLKSDHPEPVQGVLTLTHNGYGISGVDGQVITLNPGEEKTFTFNFTGQNGNSFLYAKIAPATGDDKDWSNNTATLDIPQKERPEPKASAKLTLQAKSQSGKYTRKPGEAKWTDWVTATLKPDPPTPPRGKLDWWKITKAELYHPKKHPEFTFGTPYQPKGHVVRPMEIKNDHVAELVFQQDWSMDGTPIYSQIEKKMMTTEKPRAYPIQVNYTIEYQYSYRVCGLTGCTTVTKKATVDGKERVDLLVTGTGVDSKAN